MHVTAILNSKGREVETVSLGAKVSDIVDRLAQRRIGAIVVIGNSREVAGIVSERDVVRALAQHGTATLSWSVDDIMTREVVTCTEETSIDSLMSLMTERRIRHLPVVTEGSLAGIVSIGDIVKYRVAEIELEATAMRDYITAS
jgi:CBS domain-containing protein